MRGYEKVANIGSSTGNGTITVSDIYCQPGTGQYIYLTGYFDTEFIKFPNGRYSYGQHFDTRLFDSLPNPGSQSIFVSRFKQNTAADGFEFINAQVFGSPGISMFSSNIYYSSPNLYLSGYFEGSTGTCIKPGHNNIVPPGGQQIDLLGKTDAFLTKLNFSTLQSEGFNGTQPIQYGGEGAIARAKSLQVSGDIIYLLGDFSGASISANPDSVVVPIDLIGEQDIFLSVLSTLRPDMVEVLHVGGGLGATNTAIDLAQDSTNLYITGHFSGGSIQAGPRTDNKNLKTPGGINDGYILCLDKPNYEHLNWAVSISGTSTNSDVLPLSIHKSNKDIVVAGSIGAQGAPEGFRDFIFRDSDGASGPKLTLKGNTDAFVATYSPSLKNPDINAKNYGSSNSTVIGTDIYQAGGFYQLIGQFIGSIDTTTPVASIGNNENIFIANLKTTNLESQQVKKYGASGATLNIKNISGSGAIVVSPRIYIAGEIKGGPVEAGGNDIRPKPNDSSQSIFLLSRNILL